MQTATEYIVGGKIFGTPTVEAPPDGWRSARERCDARRLPELDWNALQTACPGSSSGGCQAANASAPAKLEGAMISPEEFVERLCRLGADRGPRRFPRKTRDRDILIKSIVMLLASDRTYTEGEINAALQEWNRDVAPAISADHVTVRRILVDYGHLERTADGATYRLGFPPRPVAFDLEVDFIDVRATIAAYRDSSKRRMRPASPDRA